MWPGFSVYKVVLLDSLLVLVLLQVLTHLHVLRVGLEVGVSRCGRILRLLQLWTERERKIDGERERDGKSWQERKRETGTESEMSVKKGVGNSLNGHEVHSQVEFGFNTRPLASCV